MLCRIRVVQIQPNNHVLDHADYTVPTRQHELEIIQIRNPSAFRYLDHLVGIGDLSNM